MEKKQAAEVYSESVRRETSAGLVQSDTRNANQIVVSVNVEAKGKAKFRLTYEELLKRHLSRYQHIVHVNLDQVVDDFSIEVNVHESLPVVRVHVPELKTDPNAVSSQVDENKFSTVEHDIDGDPSKVRVLFRPDPVVQKQMLGGQHDKEGLNGQFIVEYDVDRKNEGNDVQVTSYALKC